MEVQQRLLKERELKIRATLERLRRKRHLLRSQRKNKDFPSVSVMGYTNCGESPPSLSWDTPTVVSHRGNTLSQASWPCYIILPLW